MSDSNAQAEAVEEEAVVVTEVSKEDTPLETTEAEEAAAVVESYHAAIQEEDAEDGDDPDGVNKWSKNGFGVPVATKQSGKFSKEESEFVRAAIEQFCAAKQISVSRLCLAFAPEPLSRSRTSAR